MAKGRMVNNSITEDKRVNDLSDDTCRLAFTWLVTFADRDGRVCGDPAMVRAKVFPRRSDISIEQMESYISEWQSARDPETGLGLVVWYEAKGDLWIWFPGFDRNQAGLRKDKEAPSSVPAPPDHEVIVRHLSVLSTEPVRTNSGKSTPELNRTEKNLNGIEVEKKEQESVNEFGLIARAYEDIYGTLASDRDMIRGLEQDGITAAILRQAAKAAEDVARRVKGREHLEHAGIDKWKYVLAIARRWMREGVPETEESRTEEALQAQKESNAKAMANRKVSDEFPQAEWLPAKRKLESMGLSRFAQEATPVSHEGGIINVKIPSTLSELLAAKPSIVNRLRDCNVAVLP